MKALKSPGSLLVIILGGQILIGVFAFTVGAVPATHDSSPFESPFHSPFDSPFDSPIPKPFTTSEKVPLDRRVWIPCTEEWVHLAGNLHTVLHISYDAKGGYHAESHSQPQGVRGYAEETGVKYRATGVTRLGFNGKVGTPQTFVNNFRIIGQGRDNNYLVHQTFHVTIDASGEVTAYVDNFSVDCK